MLSEKFTMKAAPFAVALILIGSPALKANATLLLNGSFEDATSGLPNDWNPGGNLQVISTQGQTDGSYALAFSYGNLPSDGQIWQTFDTIQGTAYYLNFDFGKYSVNQPDLVARLQIDIYDGDDFSGSILLTEIVEDATDTTSGFYRAFQYEFTASGASSTLRFRDFSDAQVSGGGFDAMLDKVEVTMVPEPAASALLIGGVAGVLAALARPSRRR